MKQLTAEHPTEPARPRNAPGNGESGFTLMETLIAIFILVFGLVGVTNLFLFSGTSNFVAHATTGAVAQATEVMERLRAIPFTDLQAGGDLTADAGSISACDDATESGGCVIVGNFNAKRTIPGPGEIQSRWTITAVDSQTIFISVISESTAPAIGSRARAELTTFRSCTAAAAGCLSN